MRVMRMLVLGSLLSGPTVVVGQNAVYDRPARSLSARAKILVRSTSVHQSFAGSQDIYLAEISTKRDHALAKLVDTYTVVDSPIRAELLRASQPFRMKLRRDFECDQKGGTFFLSGESLIVDPTARDLLRNHEVDIIPCYTVDHNATRLVKQGRTR